jgi:hypothetical protein
MPSFVRRCMLLIVLAALSLSLAGCGSSGKKKTEVGLTQAQADDLVQTLGSMAAIDNGGWLVAIQNTVIALPTDNRITPAPSTASVPEFLSGVLSSDSTFDRGPIAAPMHWAVTYTFFDTLSPSQPHTTWDGSIRFLDCATRAVGSLTLHDFQGSTGSGQYGLSDTMAVDGYKDTTSTLHFEGQSAVDSALVTIVTGVTPRWYYFDNLVDFSVAVAKAGTSGYPKSGTVQVDAFVDVLRSATYADRSGTILDAILTITFDGTQTPLASITANTESPTEAFRYRVNLQTGEVVRAP